MKFSRFRTFFFIFSLFAVIALYGSFYNLYGGFARSISFNGGIRLGIIAPSGVDRAELEKAVIKAGFPETQIRLIDARSNYFDLDMGPDAIDQIKKTLEEKGNEFITLEIEKKLLPHIEGATEKNIVSREVISASYGADLTEIAIKSFVITVIVIGVYLTYQFDFSFALGASLALLHDILFTVGFIGIMQIEPSIPVLAAVLTIVGYSINDTIVIFDRIRETVDDRAQATAMATMDLAITQTLSRTIITSSLTLISVFALLLGGAESLKDFAIIMIFGIFIGTYSSIFIASHFVQFYEEIRDRYFSR
ncbi:MAG: protein translocase subunit SecF, partial [Spirochaetia bacterium]|nr:protein translocase subunit SecF [Spirochaetia bacterium]